METIEAEDYAAMAGKKGNKYHAIKVEDDGYTFDSRAEHRRYQELKLMVAAGEIGALEVHPMTYKLVVNHVLITTYSPDFAYVDLATRELVLEDVKSTATAKARDWPLRKKLMLALYGIKVREVTA